MTTNSAPTSSRGDLASAPTVPLAPQRQGCSHLVRIVPYEEGEREAAATETWLQACATDDPFALELVGTRRDQGFVLRASNQAQLTLLTKQFEAQYPQAEVQRLAAETDPLLLAPGEHAVVGLFRLARPSWMPIKTFIGKALALPGGDPIHGIFAAMEPLGHAERLICQLALVRAPDSWIDPNLRKALEHPLQPERDAARDQRQASSRSDLAEGLRLAALVLLALVVLGGYRLYLAHQLLILAALVLVMLLAGSGALAWWLRQDSRPLYNMELVAEKLARQAFYTQLRVIAIGPAHTSSEVALAQHVRRLETAYRQYTLASANSWRLARMFTVKADSQQAARLCHPQHAFTWRGWLPRLLHLGALSPDVLNALELGGLFHLVQEMADLPLIRRISVKHLLASPEIMHEIEQAPTPQPPALLGHSRHRGHAVPVYLPFAALFSHMFLAARSRYGKSTLMQLLLWAVMQPVRDSSIPQPGVFVLDPHHDLVEDVLTMTAALPPERQRAVILVDLTDKGHPPGINPLDASMGFTRDQVVGNLSSIVARVWKDYYGPRMAFFLRYVFLTLYTLNELLVAAGRAAEQYTLLDVNPLLQYPDFATLVLRQLNPADPWHAELLAWWQNTYFTLPKTSSFRQEVILPILSKMAVFNDNQQLRRIMGQPVTSAHIHEAVTAGKIVLCALSSRDMDEASLNVIGSTLANLLHRSFRLQEHLPLHQRRKVFVAIDEFQAFSGAAVEQLLSEDAKYGCAALLATQYLKQLNTFSDGLLDTVLGNVEHLFAFNVSAADARILEEELQKKVSQKHIISQPRLHCYARLSLPGYPLQVLSLSLAQPLSWQRSPQSQVPVEQIRQRSRQHYLSASEVDRQHQAHLGRYLNVDYFSGWLAREADALQKTRQQQAHERDLASASGTPQAGSSQASATQAEQAGGQKGPGGPSASARTQTSTNTSDPRGNWPAQGNGAPGQPAAAAEGGAQAKRRRNHKRSRRWGKLRQAKKTPVGAAPPAVPAVDTPQQPTGTGEPRPLPPYPSSGRGSFLERETRERER